MQKIYDQKAITDALHQSRYGKVLQNLDVPLFLVQYDKGELVTAPFLPGTWFHVVVQGSLAIYIIRSDGARYALSSGGKDYILGDMELFESNGGNIYSQHTAALPHPLPRRKPRHPPCQQRLSAAHRRQPGQENGPHHRAGRRSQFSVRPRPLVHALPLPRRHPQRRRKNSLPLPLQPPPAPAHPQPLHPGRPS